MHSTFFSLIPSGVMENDKLSDGAKITYALILGLSNRYGYCFATNTALAEMRSTSESTLKRHITELLKHGCMTAEYNHRNDRRLKPIITPSNKEKAVTSQITVKNAQIDTETDKRLDEIWRSLKVYKSQRA